MVAGHQTHRAPARACQTQAELTLGTVTEPFLASCRVEQDHVVSRQDPSHRAGHNVLAGAVAHLGGRFGLPEPVPDHDPEPILDLLDDLRIERLTGAHHFAEGEPPAPWPQVLLNQHPVDGRRGTERAHRLLCHRRQQCRRVKTWLVDDQDRGFGVPRSEERRPCVLGPARRGDVEVDIPRL